MIAMRQIGLPRFRQLAPKALQILALVLQVKATPFKKAKLVDFDAFTRRMGEG